MGIGAVAGMAIHCPATALFIYWCSMIRWKVGVTLPGKWRMGIRLLVLIPLHLLAIACVWGALSYSTAPRKPSTLIPGTAGVWLITLAAKNLDSWRLFLEKLQLSMEVMTFLTTCCGFTSIRFLKVFDFF